MPDLETFVKESLIQIFNGTRAAQQQISTNLFPSEEEKFFKPYIMPTPRGGAIEKQIHEVQFDIAVTIVNNTSTKDGTNIISNIVVIPGFNIGSENQKHINHSTVNHIKFSIPVVFPSMPLKHGER